VQPPTLDATHHFGFALDFNFNPAQVRIERVHVRDLYASLYKSYAGDTVAQVQLVNLQDRPLETTLRLSLPGMTDAPTESTVVLNPKATSAIALPVVMSPRVVGQNGNRYVQAELTASYQSRRLVRSERKRAAFTAYGPGAIN